MITSFIEDIVNERVDQENIGYIDSERFMEFAKATGLKGIGPALKQMVDKGGVEKHTNKKVWLIDSTRSLIWCSLKVFSQLLKIIWTSKSNNCFRSITPHPVKKGWSTSGIRFLLTQPPAANGWLACCSSTPWRFHSRKLTSWHLSKRWKGSVRTKHRTWGLPRRFDSCIQHDWHKDKWIRHWYHQHLVVINPKPNLEFQMSYFFISLLDAMSLRKLGPRIWDVIWPCP